MSQQTTSQMCQTNIIYNCLYMRVWSMFGNDNGVGVSMTGWSFLKHRLKQPINFRSSLNLYGNLQKLTILWLLYGGFHKWGYPKWMVYNGKSQTKMDENWGYPCDLGNLLYIRRLCFSGCRLLRFALLERWFTKKGFTLAESPLLSLTV